MARDNLEELLAVLENIRATRYPHIPSEVIRKIVQTQYEHQDSRPEAQYTTRKIVSEYINSVVKSEE